MESIRENWLRLQDRIGAAAARAGRDPATIEVVAITKTCTSAQVDAAIEAGLRRVGENRVQEAEAKRPQVRSAACWHLVGHLQGNKAGKAARLFDVVESVDEAGLAAALDRRAAQANRWVEVLIQVNTSGQPHQSGVAPPGVRPLVEEVAALPHLRLRGLMTIAVQSPDDLAPVRGCFARLRQLRDELAAARLPGVDLPWLSMGMSGDYELAIAEGATLLRLGTAIFGPRPV
jgi:pyridoxal phosphate enzyme (YggS family)